MKFIFPQNYSFKSKILGFIDYTTAILDVIWGIVILGLLKMISFGISLKIFIFIVLFLPIFLISIIGFNGENIINVIYYIIKYSLKPKVLLFKK